MRHGKKIGLALSGGGYRAAIYHIGTLRKLNSMGILKDVDVISSISGGSITNAFYGLHANDFEEFEKLFQKALSKNILLLVLKAHPFRIALLPIILLILICISFYITGIYLFLILISLSLLMFFFQFKIFDISKLVSELYDEVFFQNKTIKDLKCNHNVLINATNMETGRLFSFSSTKMGDSKYANEKNIHFKNHKDYKLSKAVMASSAYPLLFNPIGIHKTDFKNWDKADTVLPALIDGGVYDNQGTSKLFEEKSSYKCDIVIASDGGKILEEFSKMPTNSIQLLVRTIFLMGTRIDRLFDSMNLYGKRKSIKFTPIKHSLYWDVHRIIPEFVNAVKEGVISTELLRYHNISDSDILQLNDANISTKKRLELINRIEEHINYKKVLSAQAPYLDLEVARQTRTSLLPINEKIRSTLIKHAEIMTELTVKVYAPYLLNENQTP